MDSDEKQIDYEGLPHVSLIMPFSHAMENSQDLFKQLTSAVDNAEKELMIKYSQEQAILLIKKLHETIRDVKCSSNGKTLDIFVSLFSKKIYYFTPTKINFMPPVLVRDDQLNQKHNKKILLGSFLLLLIPHLLISVMPDPILFIIIRLKQITNLLTLILFNRVYIKR